MGTASYRVRVCQLGTSFRYPSGPCRYTRSRSLPSVDGCRADPKGSWPQAVAVDTPHGRHGRSLAPVGPRRVRRFEEGPAAAVAKTSRSRIHSIKSSIKHSWVDTPSTSSTWKRPQVGPASNSTKCYRNPATPLRIEDGRKTRRV